jgi:hypothetical protein
VWRRLVDWPSGNVAWHPVLRLITVVLGLGVGWLLVAIQQYVWDGGTDGRLPYVPTRGLRSGSPATANGFGSASNFARYPGTLPASQDHGLCRFTDSLQGAKPPIGGQAFQFADFECGDCLGGATECSDAIRRRL